MRTDLPPAAPAGSRRSPAPRPPRRYCQPPSWQASQGGGARGRKARAAREEAWPSRRKGGREKSAPRFSCVCACARSSSCANGRDAQSGSRVLLTCRVNPRQLDEIARCRAEHTRMILNRAFLLISINPDLCKVDLLLLLLVLGGNIGVVIQWNNIVC